MEFSIARRAGGDAVLALTLLLGALMPAAPQAALSRDAAHVARRLTVTGSGEVRARPDRADITLGVVTEDHSSEAAVRGNAAASAEVHRALRVAGVADTDVQTVGYTIQPLMSEQNPVPPGVTQPRPQITGYRVYNQVRVTVRDVSRVGAVIDAATSAGSNQIENIAFALSDPSRWEDMALERAMTAARRKADRMAETAGTAIVGVYEMNEGSIARPGPIYTMARGMSDAATPIAPGETTVSANVTVVYEISGKLTPSPARRRALEQTRPGASNLQRPPRGIAHR